MVESKSACQDRVRHDAAQRRKEVFKMRDEETRSISSDWREGFAKIKQENDQRQLSNAKFTREQLAEIDTWLANALKSC